MKTVTNLPTKKSSMVSNLIINVEGKQTFVLLIIINNTYPTKNNNNETKKKHGMF